MSSNIVARTGTGKTLSFVLPIVEKLKTNKLLTTTRGRAPTVLVMSPTRELAKQIAGDFETVCPTLATLCVYGGAAYEPQENGLRKGIGNITSKIHSHCLDIIVGTPGRLIDHLEKGKLVTSSIKFVVLDEADEMLDMGFAPSMETILSKITQ
jgi:ATP-dependent RNA helicase DDX21